MQALLPYRSINRVAVIAIGVISLILITWGIASRMQPPVLSPGLDGYVAETGLRAGASTDEQISALQAQLKFAPNDWQSYSQLGLAYLQKVRETSDPTYYQKAELALNQAIQHTPDDYTAISAQGALALARHQFLAALNWGQRARQINPTRAYAYGVIADAQIELGRYDEAVQTLQNMVDLRPDMSSFSRISYIRELHGDTGGALDMMQQAVDSGVPNSESTAWSRYQLATLDFNMGNLAQAENEFQHTLQDRPGYVYALAGLGKVRAAQGRSAEAIQLLTQASDKVPLPDFVITLGDLYQASGQSALAQQQYKLVGAIEKLYQANGVDLDMESALFNADHSIDMPATVALARKAFADRPSIQGADVLAWSLYKAGNIQEASQYSQQALQLGTRDALKLFHAGLIADGLGDKNSAYNDLKQALAINPYFSILYAGQAQQMLKTLQAEQDQNAR
jgi:tetratricopeptide (TPR) repeat protein